MPFYRRLAPWLVLLASVLVICARPLSSSAGEPAQWTLMMYMDCNNDLEAAQLDNLKDLVLAGSSKDVNIVALCARSPKGNEEDGYTNEGVANLPNWATGKLLFVAKGRLKELADWGIVNMAEGATLQKFLKEASAAYPARHYALVICNHGMSWPGCCGDEREEHEKDILRIEAIRDALKGFGGARGSKMDLVGFDACLMGNFEAARALAGGARYLVGSEELEPSTGWAYQKTIPRLLANPRMDGAQLGRLVADDYLAQFLESDDEDERDTGAGVTLSCIDLDRLAGLAQAVDALGKELARELGSSPSSWTLIGKARRQAEEYGKSGDDDTQVFDLGHFARLLEKSMGPSSKVGQAAGAVRQGLRGCVIHSVHGKAHPGATGLSAFIPNNKELLEGSNPVAYRSVPLVGDSGWLGFLAAYTHSVSLQTTPPKMGGLSLSGRVLDSAHPSITITSSAAEKDVEDAWFILSQEEDGRRLIIGQTQAGFEDGKLREEWDGGWFAIVSGDTHVIAPIASLEELEGPEDAVLARVPAQYRRAKGGKWKDVTLHFLMKFTKNGVTGRLVYAYREARGAQTQVRLQQGDLVRPVYLAIDEKGEESEVISEDRGEHLVVGKNGRLSVEYEEVPAGKYYVGFVISDYGGKSTQQTAKIEVKDR